MATTEPLTGITVQDQSDAAQGGLEIGNLAKALAPLTIPRYSSTSARDSATSAFTSGGGVMAEGQYCEVTGTKQMYRWTSGSWQWPPWAQGQLTRADFTDSTNSGTNYMTPLAATATGLPAFNVSTPTMPGGRHYKVTFAGSIMTDAANTAYGFVINVAGKQHRGVVQIPMASSTASPVPQAFNISYEFDLTSAVTPATGGITAGGRFGGTGNCYLVTPSGGLDGPCSLMVEDLGSS